MTHRQPQRLFPHYHWPGFTPILDMDASNERVFTLLPVQGYCMVAHQILLRDQHNLSHRC